MISRLVAILISSYLLSTLVPAQQLRPSICIEPGHRYAYWLSVAFSPDGKCVLSSSGSCSRLWDTRTGKTIGVAEGHTIMASSPGGKLLIGGRLYASFKDIATGKSPRLLEYDGPRGIWSAAFSPDGRYVLAGCTDGTSRLWDTEAPSGDATLRAFREFEDHGKLVFTTVAFSPDGKYVISEGDDTILRLWDFATGKVIKRFRHAGLVRSVAFSPDG